MRTLGLSTNGQRELELLYRDESLQLIARYSDSSGRLLCAGLIQSFRFLCIAKRPKFISRLHIARGLQEAS
jgi:hypothetical protein